jgi:hypothetical protein
VRPVRREELVDWQTWAEERRPAEIDGILAVKAARRVHVGDTLTLLFENRDTIRYQVQEMLRVERIVKESDVRHELETYNELLGGEGELGCVLLVEIVEEDERDQKLRRWLDLPETLWLELDDGTRVRPRVDERQRSDRLSSVQYLKFPVAGRTPVAAGCDHPELRARTELSPETRRALEQDLRT